MSEVAAGDQPAGQGQPSSMPNPLQTPLKTPLSRRLAWGPLAKTLDDAADRTHVLATFTANPLEAYLGVALHEAGMPSAVVIGPFDQIHSECLLQHSETAQAQPTVVVVWPRVEDLWRGGPLPLFDELDSYVAPFLELADVARAAARRWSATLVFVLPAHAEVRPLGVGDAGNPLGVAAAGDAVRSALRNRLGAQAGVLVVDADEVIRTLGTATALNARTLTTARVPYSQAMFMEMAERIARALRLARQGARKVAVVDADNTLWGGVVGEDGAHAVDLLDNGPGEAYREFQRWLLELRRAGTLIALASKNNDVDVWDVFARRDMVLQREHLANARVNWEPKSRNIAEMAEELALGLSSFVFIDDNPIERAEVASIHPEVGVLAFPADPSQWAAVIAHSGVLDRLAPTPEDLARARGYAEESQRQVLRAHTTPESYLEGLGIVVHFFRPSTSDLARLVQLFAKTNQFTLGGPRFTEGELLGFLFGDGPVIRLVSVSDRFGDYGIVGATIIRPSRVATGTGHGPAGSAELIGFVLSCRAMGRGVEESMLADACEIGSDEMSVLVTANGKNVPGVQFFARMGVPAGEQTLVKKVRHPSHVVQVSVNP